ncbi:MAG TPA: hypothetical protein VJ987_08455 [Anaerolineales bacterium]|nr:hypothetical protein [Anaerolineales bacterium]
MPKRVRTISVSALLTFVLLAVNVSGTFAAPPQGLHIEVDESIVNIEVPEAFVASGSAVDNGTVCATGTVYDASVETFNPQNESQRILHVLKRFACDDGSGTFDVRMVVNLDLTTHYTTASWMIVGGTGDYTSLHGNGSLAGTPIDPGTSIHDVYDGNVH